MKKNKRPSTLTDEMVLAAELVFVRMAKVETIRPIVEAYQLEVLKEFKPRISDEYKNDPRMNPNNLEFVETWDDLGLADLEGDEMKSFWEALHEKHIENGFDVKLPYCPLLIAEHEVREAKWACHDAFFGIHKIPKGKYIPFKIQKELDELYLKMAAPYVRSVEELMALETV